MEDLERPIQCPEMSWNDHSSTLKCVKCMCVRVCRCVQMCALLCAWIKGHSDTSASSRLAKIGKGDAELGLPARCGPQQSDLRHLTPQKVSVEMGAPEWENRGVDKARTSSLNIRRIGNEDYQLVLYLLSGRESQACCAVPPRTVGLRAFILQLTLKPGTRTENSENV